MQHTSAFVKKKRKKVGRTQVRVGQLCIKVRIDSRGKLGQIKSRGRRPFHSSPPLPSYPRKSILIPIPLASYWLAPIVLVSQSALVAK